MTDHEKYMKEAINEARHALKNGEFPVGCVMVYDDEIISRGQRINSREASQNEMDHSEIIAIRKVVDKFPDLDHSAITVYSTMEPCLMCYATMLLNGVRKFVYGYEDIMGGGTNLDLASLSPLYRKMSVQVIPHIMRNECLELFRAFFANETNSYWQDSNLARYTLSQCYEAEKK